MKSPPKEHLPTKKVLLLLANGFEAYEASVFTDVLGWSKAFGDIPVEVTTTGRHQKLKCTWNFTVIPEIQNVVVDGNIITSSSPATALDVAIKLLEMLTSQKNCEKVKKWMGF